MKEKIEMGSRKADLCNMVYTKWNPHWAMKYDIYSWIQITKVSRVLDEINEQKK